MIVKYGRDSMLYYETLKFDTPICSCFQISMSQDITIPSRATLRFRCLIKSMETVASCHLGGILKVTGLILWISDWTIWNLNGLIPHERWSQLTPIYRYFALGTCKIALGSSREAPQLIVYVFSSFCSLPVLKGKPWSSSRLSIFADTQQIPNRIPKWEIEVDGKFISPEVQMYWCCWREFHRCSIPDGSSHPFAFHCLHLKMEMLKQLKSKYIYRPATENWRISGMNSPFKF